MIAQRARGTSGRVAGSIQLLAHGGTETQSHKGARHFHLRRRLLAWIAVTHVNAQDSKDETLFALVACHLSFSARLCSASAIKRRKQDQFADFADDSRGKTRSAATA